MSIHYERKMIHHHRRREPYNTKEAQPKRKNLNNLRIKIHKQEMTKPNLR